MEPTMHQLERLKGDIDTQQQIKTELEIVNANLKIELSSNQEELVEQEKRLAELRAVLPVAPEDEVISLDVGGKVFKTYRSTLTQFEQSVLAALVSTRWVDGATQSNGQVFLDMSPDAFEEILEFLRERRFNPCALASFSDKASRLADYLNIPSGIDMKMTSTEDGDNRRADYGFMFDVTMRGPWSCTLLALCFILEKACHLNIYKRDLSYTEEGTYGWSQIGSVAATPGMTRIEFPKGQIHLKSGETKGIYLQSSSYMFLHYNSKPKVAKYDCMSSGALMHGDMQIVCSPGRICGVQPFSKGSLKEERFFVGEIEYNLL